jgi:transcriptional regulator with XRE-family HTH domain
MADLVNINGAKLRLYRKSRGYTQQTLADRAGVSRSFIAEIERGAKLPRVPVARSLAGVLAVELELLTIA